jgi:hypothetical protein
MLVCYECGSQFAPHAMAIVQDGRLVSPCEHCHTLLEVPMARFRPNLAPRRGPPSIRVRVSLPAA